jgi:hypothetical protein
MERKIYIILICIIFIVGCASVQNQSSFKENTFFCDYPKLKVQILKNVLQQTEKSKQGRNHRRTNHWFRTGSGEFVGVEIWRFRHSSSTTWDYSSDKQILIDMDMVPLGPIKIDNKTWIKFAYVKFENYVQFGYFKRMDNNLVAVYCEIKNEKYKGEIESYKATRVLTDRHKQLINEAFDHIEKLFVIG